MINGQLGCCFFWFSFIQFQIFYLNLTEAFNQLSDIASVIDWIIVTDCLLWCKPWRLVLYGATGSFLSAARCLLGGQLASVAPGRRSTGIASSTVVYCPQHKMENGLKRLTDYLASFSQTPTITYLSSDCSESSATQIILMWRNVLRNWPPSIQKLGKR